MGLLTSVKRMVSGGESAESAEAKQEPTHVCDSCGAEFALRRPEIDPQDCPECGGVKIHAI